MPTKSFTTQRKKLPASTSFRTPKKWLSLSLSLLFFPAISLADTTNTSFTSPEHTAIGNNVILYLSIDDKGQAGIPLHLPNGLNLTYGEILAMGDFYGMPDQPISQGKTEEERRALFLKAFDALAKDKNVVNEANTINQLFHEEAKALQQGIQDGKLPKDVYKNIIGDTFDRQYNCATGGGCTEMAWWLIPGRYLTLANSNYDHFGENAITTYKTGHQLAIELAIKAHATNDMHALQVAYAMNAFACHFLSDRFAAGHIRTPRNELSREVKTATIGSLLTNYMHNEENELGFHVHNAQKMNWMAYGDKSYFDPKAKAHKDIINQTMQNSADAIFLAFNSGEPNLTVKQTHDKKLIQLMHKTRNTGESTCDNNTISPGQCALNLIPQPDEMSNGAKHDVSPLFYWDSAQNKLMRRTDMTNYYDYHWTSDWWGWTTLIELRRERGFSLFAKSLLARSDLRNDAIKYGLLDKDEVFNKEVFNKHSKE